MAEKKGGAGLRGQIAGQIRHLYRRDGPLGSDVLRL